MIIGIGVDLTEQSRIRAAVERHGERFLQRVFTAHELAYCQRYHDAIPHLAGRFAVKEATMKALGAGLAQHVFFSDIEVVHLASGAPSLVLYRQALQLSQQRAITQMHVTLTHSGDLAVAVVVLES